MCHFRSFENGTACFRYVNNIITEFTTEFKSLKMSQNNFFENL